MQVTNNPADIVTDKEMEYLRDANERQTRQFAAIIAERNGRHGVSLVWRLRQNLIPLKVTFQGWSGLLKSKLAPYLWAFPPIGLMYHSNKTRKCPRKQK